MTPEALAAIHARAMVVPSPWSAQTLAGFIEARGAVLTTSDAGFALGRVIADEAELLTLAVDPRAQRTGQGHACLKAFGAQAFAKGARRCFLEVAVTNEAARALYTKAGYVQDGVRRGYYKAADAAFVDAIVMSKTLLSA